MIDVSKLVLNAYANRHEVPIMDLGDGYTKVYRRTIKDADLLKVAKEKLVDALTCLSYEDAMNESQKLPCEVDTVHGALVSILGNHLTIQSTQDAQYRARAFDRVKEAWAILAYVVGDEVIENEYSNYLLK